MQHNDCYVPTRYYASGVHSSLTVVETQIILVMVAAVKVALVLVVVATVAVRVIHEAVVALIVIVIVIVISRFLKRYSTAKRTRAPAYSRALRRIKGRRKRSSGP